MGFGTKKQFRRIVSFILTILITVSAFQFTVAANNGGIEIKTSDGFKYYVDFKTSSAVIVSYVGGSKTFSVPAKIDGYSVLTIDVGAFSGTNATSITISSGIKNISSGCFANSSTLTTVSLPASVTSIGIGLFTNSTALLNVTFGSSIKEIPAQTFDGCESLTSVATSSGLTSIGKYAFRNCKKLKSFTIGSSVTTIGFKAFEGCIALEKISVPSSVSSIEDYAFLGCTSLGSFSFSSVPSNVGEGIIDGSLYYQTASNWNNGCLIVNGVLLSSKAQSSINVPDGVKQTADNVFSNGTVKTVKLPSSLTKLGNEAFFGASSLQEIVVDSANSVFQSTEGILIRKSDGALLVYPAKKSGDNCTLPSTVKKIGESAFENNTYVKNITLSSSLTVIEANAFKNCITLSAINFSSALVTIGEFAFSGCSSLKNVSLPSSVKNVGNYAFSECKSLESASISSGMSALSMGIFEKCTSLKSINLGSKIFARFLDFGIADAVESEKDVRAYSAGEKEHVLKHLTEMAS